MFRLRFRIAYVAAVGAALGGAIAAAWLDLHTPVALLPLSLTLAAPIVAALATHRRSLVLIAAILVQTSIVFLAGFSIGLWFLPSASLVLVGASLEAFSNLADGEAGVGTSARK